MTEKQPEPQIEKILASIQDLMVGAAALSDEEPDAPGPAEPPVRRTAGPEPPTGPLPWPTGASQPDGALVSGDRAEQAIGSFARLDREFSASRATQSDGPMIGDNAVTLDNMVRDLIRPMLKDWLDRNLPGIVETLVREEIRRLAALARERDS